MPITRLSGGLTPANGSDPRTFPAIFNGAADDIEALQANGSVVTDRIADGAVTAPKLATTAGAVMVFDDAAARTTAIPTPSEGMVTYLKDTDAVEKFDGSAFVDAAPPQNLVAVKHALFTGTQTESVLAGDNFAVDNLSITHTLADPDNALIISAYFGAAANGDGQGRVGIAVMDDATLIGIGDAEGSRTRVGAGGLISPTVVTFVVTMPSVQFVYLPDDTNAHTYTVRAINIQNTSTRTLYINRSQDDTNNGGYSRTSSGFVIQEVKV